MKRIILILAALVAFSSLAMADAKTQKKDIVQKPKQVEATKLHGTVVSVDAIANTVTLKLKTGEETLAVDKAAKIKAEGKEIKLADVKKESKVSVHYKMEAGKKVATSIFVISEKAPAPAKK
jgi:hypothetical protein